MLTARYKAAFNLVTHAIARLLVKFRITPNMVTLSGLLLLGIAVGILFLTKNLVLFCILVGVFSLTDGLDGAVARVTGRCTKFGSYLDAMVDRYYDVILVLAVALIKGYWVLSFLFIAGSFAVSYAKARAAMEITVENNAWPDFMERCERVSIYVAGLFVSEITHWTVGSHELFFWVLLFLVIATHSTVVQRMVRAKERMKGC